MAIELTNLKDIKLGTNSVSIYFGELKVFPNKEPWDTPLLTLSDKTIVTDYVIGVTKYKVYDNGTYIGYIDSDNVWHGEVSE